MFTCKNPTRSDHQHTSITEARACWFPPETVPVAVTTGQVSWRATPGIMGNAHMATEAQVKYLKDLGYAGSAHLLTSREASRLIESYKSRKATVTQATTSISEDPKVKALGMFLPGMADGYYAVRADDTQPFAFVRVALVKTGRWKGLRKISSQHGPRWDNEFLFRSDSTIFVFGHRSRAIRVAEAVMMAAASQTDASLNYAIELGRCCRCNAELTDERSRWYGIGPECETHRPDIIEAVDYRNEETYEERKASLR